MGKDLTALIRHIIYFFKKLWYGECPDCRIRLVPIEGWGRSDCPSCGSHFKDW